VRSVQERINYLIISTFAMLAKRPESVSLNWSLQSREKRAIKIIPLSKTDSKKKKREKIFFLSFSYKKEKFTSFSGEILCSRNVRRQKSVDLEIMFTSVG